MSDDDILTAKQARWIITKMLDRRDRAEQRGVATTIAEVRKKRVCRCGHTMKHHKKTGRCRGKILTEKQTQGREIADAYDVPPRLLRIPASCDCDAGAR